MTGDRAIGFAAAILAVHLFIIGFNLFGLIVTPLGAWLNWRFVRVRWWRLLHLASLSVVALQALVGRACFLTIWQVDLTSAGARPTPMIMDFVNRMLFWPLPLWAFTVLYVAVLIYALTLWRLVPPRPTGPGPTARRDGR